jgi:hypothetical protein
MIFSRKTLPTGIKIKGRHPLQAASRVINASASATSALARCWVHSSHKTTQLLRSVRNEGLRRAYSSRSSGSDGFETGTSSKALPLYQRLMNAWTETPTKWYPLPLALGALLLVAIQYRKRIARSEKEVHLNDEGLEVIKLKGPWQVSFFFCFLLQACVCCIPLDRRFLCGLAACHKVIRQPSRSSITSCLFLNPSRFTCLARCPSVTCPAFGVT